MFKSKIQRPTITDADLYYEGSLAVDSDLLNAADILPHEKVQVVNVNTGSRLETYAIKAPSGSGDVVLNGAAARLGAKGDEVIIITYAMMDDEEAKNFSPKVIIVDKQNKITETRT